MNNIPEEVAVALDVLKIRPDPPSLIERARRVVYEYLGGFIAEKKSD